MVVEAELDALGCDSAKDGSASDSKEVCRQLHNAVGHRQGDRSDASVL